MNSSGLHLLIADRERANHEIFYNASGFWYWDDQDAELNANPFQTASLTMLAPGVWADDHNAFLLHPGEDWRSGRSDHSLLARKTQIWILPGLARSQWSKISEIKYDIWTQGTIWKAGTQLYFAPDSGQNNGFSDALYLVLNLDALTRDLASRQSPNSDKALEARREIQGLDSSGSMIVCRMTLHYY